MKDAFTRPLTLMALMLALGVVGDGLLRALPWGVNVTLWVTAVIAAAICTARTSGCPLSREARILLALAWAFSVGFTLWDATHLRVFDAFAVLGCLGMALGALGAPDYWRTTAGSVVARAAMLAPHSGMGLHALGEAAGETVHREDQSRLARQCVLGVLLAVPFLVVFGMLFFLADATMETFVRDVAKQLARMDPFSHAAWISVSALFAGAVLVHFVKPVTPRAQQHPMELSGAAVAANIAITLIDLLFLLFVVLQLGYFFGGNAAVQQTPDLSYAAYAKRGFFELLFVAGGTLMELLFLQLFVVSATARQKRAFHVAAGAQIVLTFFVLASALHRLALYVDAYGLTVSRVYGLAGLLWVGMVLAWMGYTSLREQRDRFFIGGAYAAIALLLLLNVQSPDALVARLNLTYSATLERIDEDYLARLSADAVPAIARHYSEGDLPKPVAQQWEKDRARYQSYGIRSFNLARWRAYK